MRLKNPTGQVLVQDTRVTPNNHQGVDLWIETDVTESGVYRCEGELFVNDALVAQAYLLVEVTAPPQSSPMYLENYHDRLSRESCETLGFPGNTFQAFVRRLRYAVLDENTVRIQQAGMTIAEDNYSPGGTCGTRAPGNSTWTTAIDGSMTQDDIIANCSMTCYYGGDCTASWSQQFTVDGTVVHICVPNCPAAVWANNWATSCSAYPSR